MSSEATGRDEIDENKRDFELLTRRRVSPLDSDTSNPSANGGSVSPLSSHSDESSHLSGTDDMIWPLQLTPSFVDHYIIGDAIGRGSYAEVRECVDVRTLERCALKIVNKSFLTRQAPRALAKQLLEIRLLRHLSHPNLVALRECLFKGQWIYIALEYCAFNLDELLRDQPGKSLHVAIARPLFLQLSSAVAYLHSAGIIHRDIKPNNILLTTGGTLKLIDFGVSHVLSMWQRHDLCANYEGSPLFQAPEVVAGQREYHGFKVDVWSCGVTLYLMLFGQCPFNDDALLGLYDKILAEELVIPATHGQGLGSVVPTGPALTDLLAWMLEKEHTKRASIEQVLASPWCQLVENFCEGPSDDPLDQLGHSEFFELVVRRHQEENKDLAEVYASSQYRDVYKSMSCLPYLYQHHFPHLPIGKSASSSRQSSEAIIERINLISPGASSRDSTSRASSTSALAELPSTSTGANTENEMDAINQVEWGTREQYHLMKVPQVRANRVRCGAASKARERNRRRKRGIRWCKNRDRPRSG